MDRVGAVSREAVLAQLVPETSLTDAEQPSRPRFHLLRLSQRAQDHVPLEMIEGLVQIETGGGLDRGLR